MALGCALCIPQPSPILACPFAESGPVEQEPLSGAPQNHRERAPHPETKPKPLPTPCQAPPQAHSPRLDKSKPAQGQATLDHTPSKRSSRSTSACSQRSMAPVLPERRSAFLDTYGLQLWMG